VKHSLVVGATGLMLVFGCSSGKSTGGGTGGVPSGGGVIGTGGTVSTGGLVGTGGSTNSPGGGPGSGGIGTGGIRGTGGIVGTGGSTNSLGGGPGSGGIGTGGIVGTGGIGGTAGIRGTGGNVTGGVRGTGGLPGTGGVPAGTGGVSAAGGSTTTQVPGATLFPASAPWYQDVTGATLDAQSAAVIAGLSAKGGWGAGSFRIDFSIEVLRADASVTPRAFTKSGDFYDPDCDFVPMPVPPTGRLEGETNYACASDGDCHLLVIQGTKLFEMWRANITGGTATGTPFDGGCLAVWDLTRDYWKPAAPPAPFARGDQCTSADAAGYPISALLFSADEVASGSLNHAIRFILPNDRITKGAYVHPATHSGAGKGTPSNDTVPYGARLRLKSTFNLAGLPNEGARTVAKALQRYGMFLADGGNIALTAQADTYTTAKWSGLLGSSDLSTVKVTDFEMIDGGTRIPLTLDCVRTPL
jgi:serine/threonine-protein kinase